MATIKMFDSLTDSQKLDALAAWAAHVKQQLVTQTTVNVKSLDDIAAEASSDD